MPSQLTTLATVLRRSDFRESSRIVSLVARDHGRIFALAKGAHRPDSAFLGRLDFLNEVQATFSADRGGLRLLVRAELVRERRELRQPERFVAANHLAQLCEFSMTDARPDPLSYDLLTGGLSLLEKCPVAALPRVVLGLELRLLDHLGALPDLERCTDCGVALPDRAYQTGDALGLFCREHAGSARRAVDPAALELLRWLWRAPGRTWPQRDSSTPSRLAATLPATWLQAALELRPRWRHLVFA